MTKHITSPATVTAAGNKPKIIREFVGRVNTGEERISIAHMVSPGGWTEPGQRPDFDEYSVVIKGTLQVRRKRGRPAKVTAGQAFIAKAGEWVQYSTPGPGRAEYVSVCLPAFSPETVHRDEE